MYIFPRKKIRTILEGGCERTLLHHCQYLLPTQYLPSYERYPPSLSVTVLIPTVSSIVALGEGRDYELSRHRPWQRGREQYVNTTPCWCQSACHDSHK